MRKKIFLSCVLSLVWILPVYSQVVSNAIVFDGNNNLKNYQVSVDELLQIDDARYYSINQSAADTIFMNNEIFHLRERKGKGDDYAVILKTNLQNEKQKIGVFSSFSNLIDNAYTNVAPMIKAGNNIYLVVTFADSLYYNGKSIAFVGDILGVPNNFLNRGRAVVGLDENLEIIYLKVLEMVPTEYYIIRSIGVNDGKLYLAGNFESTRKQNLTIAGTVLKPKFNYVLVSFLVVVDMKADSVVFKTDFELGGEVNHIVFDDRDNIYINIDVNSTYATIAGDSLLLNADFYGACPLLLKLSKDFEQIDYYSFCNKYGIKYITDMKMENGALYVIGNAENGLGQNGDAELKFDTPGAIFFMRLNEDLEKEWIRYIQVTKRSKPSEVEVVDESIYFSYYLNSPGVEPGDTYHAMGSYIQNTDQNGKTITSLSLPDALELANIKMENNNHKIFVNSRYTGSFGYSDKYKLNLVNKKWAPYLIYDLDFDQINNAVYTLDEGDNYFFPAIVGNQDVLYTSTDDLDNTSIEIYDVMGRKCGKQKISDNQLDLKGFKLDLSGLYFLKKADWPFNIIGKIFIK